VTDVRLLPLKRFVDPRRPITYGIVQAGPNMEDGIPYIRPVDMYEHEGVLDPDKLLRTSPEIAVAYRRSTVQTNDIIVSIGPSFGKTMIVGPELQGANLTQGTARVGPATGVHAQYLRWALRSKLAVEYWESVVAGATFRALNLEPLSKTPIPWWDIQTQQAIGDFLDAETVRIDDLIIKKRRMIDLVRARFDLRVRQILSDPSWPSLPLKRRWMVIDCKHRTPFYVEEGFPVVSPGDTTPGRLDLSRCHRFVDTADFKDLTAGGRRPQRGDIIYSRNASVGIASYVDTDVPFCMGQDVCLIKSKDQEQRFLTFVLNSFGLDQLELTKVGSTFTRINVAQISELRVPCPQVEVQRHVADYLGQLASTASQITERLHRQLGLLQEHRQALISSAVTGQLDIPGAAA
jgi:type I restriction enzyme S subunit